VTIKKFVPFTTLEIEATVESIGDVTLPDYKKMKLARSTVKITDSDVQDVVESLRIRAATRKEVKRVAAINDEVLIDFEGTDAKTKEPIQGADGKAYPLILGSNAFIPGFEDNVIGMKAGEEKSFVITFPKDYGVAELQNKKVNFKTTAATVSEMVKPEITDAFAATVGPFKTVDDLKADVKKQLGVERQQQAERAYENELIDKIAEESQVALPKTLVDEEIERIISEERQNAVYRGQTWNEYLDGQGVKEDVYQELKRPIAEKRVKASLMLSAVAEKENIDVTKDELEIRLQLLKGQYTDKAMQDELNKPENRREIVSRLVTEKTVNKLKEYASN
jgi:trigger factor